MNSLRERTKRVINSRQASLLNHISDKMSHKVNSTNKSRFIDPLFALEKKKQPYVCKSLLSWTRVAGVFSLAPKSGSVPSIK